MPTRNAHPRGGQTCMALLPVQLCSCLEGHEPRWLVARSTRPSQETVTSTSSNHSHEEC